MTKGIDGVGIAVTTVGGMLIYSGIKGYSLLAVAQNLITGKPITTGVTVVNPLTGVQSAPETSPDTSVNAPTQQGGTPLGIGQSMAAQYGWTGAEWNALKTLWQHESNWNPRAKNPSSGAYGIPQALPPTKMPKKAQPESMGGSSDAATQIRWGLNYIKGRYGSPSKAWAFWQRQSPNWY